MTGNAWGAEEVVQDVFMTLMREPKKYDAGRGAVGAYLFGIARNRVMKYLERLPRELSLEEHNGNGVGASDATVNAFSPVQWAEQQERSERVRAAVLELPAEFREAVVLCELEELRSEGAVRLRGCSVGTIWSRLRRGLALLGAVVGILWWWVWCVRGG